MTHKENHRLTHEENQQLTEERIRLYQKIEQFIENLPEILSQMGTAITLAAPQKTAAATQSKEEESLSISQIQKHQESLIQQQPSKEAIANESANMELGDLLGTVLGEDRMKRIELTRN